jgi:hypothetical protein
MGDIVGKYKGIKVYEVTLPEYVNGRLYKDEENMYLIGEDLIYKNETFANYNGTYVEEYDAYKRATYYTVPKITTATVEAKVVADGKGVRYVEYETNLPDPVGISKNETKTSEAGAVATVEETLAGVYETDYFSSMTDIDAFLKVNS